MDAVEKLRQEQKNPDKGISKQAAALIYPICEMLISFCKQDQRFADAVFEKKETLSDCVKAVANGVTYMISDVDAYKKAVQFYFPAADVDFKCVIVLPAEKSGVVTRGIGRAADADEEPEEITVSLFDIF